jgi:heme/copper-type cytochrome/quinol oxidase subunit 2
MSCECETNYKEDSLSLKCTYNWSHEPNNNESIWKIFSIIALVLLLIIGIVIGICYYVVKKRKVNSFQESNIRFNCNPPIIQQNPNLSIISHNVAIDDPPPPYSSIE